MSFGTYLHESTALLCLMMAAGTFLLARREAAPRSAAAFSIGYLAFAISTGIGLLFSRGSDALVVTMIQNLGAMAGFVAFWWGCWNRSGEAVPQVFLGGIALVWLLGLVPWLLIEDQPELRMTLISGCMAAGTLSAGWAIWSLKPSRNSADVLIVLLLTALLLGQLGLVLARDLLSASPATLGAIVGASVPVFLVGVGLFSSLSVAFDALDELDQQSETDPLTGLLNRRAFDKRMQTALDSARRYRRPLSVVMADLDHFKNINDSWGHAAGDVILKDFASLIQRGSRSIDFIARLGGEEFIVVMPESTAAQARGFADRIRQACERRLQIGGRPVTASFGVADATAPEVDLQGLLLNVDKALYAAKESGRNRVVVFGAEHGEHIEEQLNAGH